MLRYILRHCCVLLGVVIIFFTISSLNCNVKDKYPKLNDLKIGLATDSDAYLSEDNIDTVVYKDDNTNADMFPDCFFALFLNETDHEVYTAKNVHTRMYPASMTKYMTAIIVCEKIESGEISLDDVVTVQKNYDLSGYDVAPNTLSAGNKITVKDLLYGLMIESNNYFALILADYVSGDSTSFCDLMNKKAHTIGATNTHYMNPHGLDDTNHYSTAYDIYLITKEAYKHPILHDIDTLSEYTYTYYDNNGIPVYVDISATNMFVTGKVNLPANYHIVVWKTGTTTGAGNCLSMYLTKDGKDYFIVAASGVSKNVLYDALIKMLCSI